MPAESRILLLAKLFRSGALSPSEVARAQLKAIAERGSQVNAFCCVDPQMTIRMAQEAEARHLRGEAIGPLDGVPTTVKDTINVSGWPTRRGSTTSLTGPVRDDATVIRRLREAGAVFIGKTTTPEFAWKGVTDSPLSGTTRNPLDLSRTSGGSSGGAAAAIALGIGAMAVATDAAGSVRIPAAFCGTVGFKPTFGLIPLDPYPAAFSQLPHIGPITASVVDAAISASVMSGPTAVDWTSLRQHPLWFDDIEHDTDLAGLRIGVPSDLTVQLDGDDILKPWRDFLATLHTHFASLQEVDLSFVRARDIAGVLYRIGCADAVHRVPVARRNELDPELMQFIAPLHDLCASDVIQLYRDREEIANHAASVLGGQVDVVLTPTMAIAAPTIDALQQPGRSAGWLDWNVFTPLFNLAHGPAISIPWPSQGGLPIGIQVAAAPGADRRVLRVARFLERLSSFAPTPLVFDSALSGSSVATRGRAFENNPLPPRESQE
ncbi:amidase family protein [Mesorhizobium sp. B2-4-17]|uniref:amidase n=1 Tax=Mesorhizobium sp. B2-4-17 TaxID=2589932 RepID=UPI00112E277D|nr:amidase family protein [Mesorhizobium sp. B2-4-17]TPK91499.1 amidase [Mesorhizobium sp. B2-4-17]